MKVSIIILNYNTFGLTCACIQSIKQYTKGIDYEIVLVDNNSSECDPLLFIERFPQLVLVVSTDNGGFAKGNNLGIEKSTGDIILLLNSDTYLTEDSVGKAAHKLMDLPLDVGVVGARMVYPDGRVQYTARRFRSIWWELLDFVRVIPFCFPYPKRAEMMLGKYFKHDVDMYCDWLNGAFFMFRREVLLQLPNKRLDERFFMYGEDHLWCYQFGKLGYKCFFYAGTTIVHINNGSTKKGKQLQLRHVMAKNELVIIKERKGGGLYFFIFAIIYLSKEYGRLYLLWLMELLKGN